ncbi:cation channel family protein [Tritrichomonas foetus]|uniref:Cation channel family protein n=1 Tax=Tritrichomonas foetus TaxID=1144522 RepID=A0A1J4K6E5_9EUKA|nr:cation channel family protein [Tritrichomonas foetus]|eukprot:OHT07033.1 cation channel family protein [Tritrichomonas foetus]
MFMNPRELPSLTNSIEEQSMITEEKPYGIYPYQIKRRIWEYIMYFLSMTCLWELPFEWFFNIERTIWYILPALIIDVFYLADCFIVMRTGYLQNGVIILDKEHIKGHISKWRLIIYWLSPWPYYLIGWFIGNDVVFRVLVSLKCLRFLRLYDALQIINDTLVYISPISRMISLFCGIFTIAHYCACIFWYTGYFEVPNRSWLDSADIITKPKAIQYFHTLYYITTTILTIGYGDLHPYTFPEVCVVICIEAVGVFFYNYLVSNMVSIVANPTRNSFLTKYHRIYSAFKYRGVSDESMEELLRYYEYVWERDHDRADFYETASKMPEKLQKKLELSLHGEVFTKVEALRGADEDSLEKVAMALRPRIFTPNDFIIKAGRVSGRIFFITEGKVAVINANGQTINTFDGSTGCVFGDVSMLTGAEEVASAIAETYVEAFELLKEDFDRIVEEHPQFQARLAKTHARYHKKP